MLSVELSTSIASPWSEMNRLLLAGVPDDPRQPADLYIAISDDGRPALRADIYRTRPECLAFQDAIVWNKRVYVGYGETVYVIAPARPIASSLIPLHSGSIAPYFESFYAGSNYLLVACGDHLLRLTHDGRVLWSANGLGLDGVVVHSVENGVIHGEGDWDPPGGWKPFALRLDSGHTVNLND